METNDTFDALSYFKDLTLKNKLARDNGFHPCFCSGPEELEDVMQLFGKYKNFVVIDDTTSQNTYSKGVTFFDKNVYTVFFIAAYRHDDMKDREQKLNLCRKLFRQFHSRIIHDKCMRTYGDMLDYIDIQQIYSRELPRYSINGATGLYMMVTNDEPIDLTFDESEWDM